MNTEIINIQIDVTNLPPGNVTNNVKKYIVVLLYKIVILHI